MHRPYHRGLIAGAALVVLGGLVLSTGAAASTAARLRFGRPVKVTPDLGFGYEPGVVVDPYGNIFATAHKENWQLVIAPDPDSPTFTRSMSWDWVSVDGGRTFVDIPGLSPASLEQHEFGDEGDMAVDQANHLYFVDTNVGDVTFTRWTATGNSLRKITLDFTRPVLPSIEAVDDRPWVVAHGSSSVFYFGNDGTKTQDGARYTMYPSYDGGQTFDSVGIPLPDSGWCRPVADPTAGSKYVYAICTNDADKLYSFVSSDDGHTWSRYTMGAINSDDGTQSWPTAAVAGNGSVWALYVDAVSVDGNGVPVTNKLLLFHSKDHGKTWIQKDITPQVGRYEFGWLSAPSQRMNRQRLGFGVYFRPDNSSPWRVYGAVWTEGLSRPALISLDEQNPVAGSDHDEAPADLMSSAFGPDGRLSVVWTRIVGEIPGTASLMRDIYYAKQL
jgi:hypothetical protein